LKESVKNQVLFQSTLCRSGSEWSTTH